MWIFFLSYTGPGHEKFYFMQFVGFIIMFFGILIYNEILIIPAFGMKDNTATELENKAERE